MNIPSVEEVKRIAAAADSTELAALERALEGDMRKGVLQALRSAHARINAEAAEHARLEGLYAFERDVAQSHGAKIVVGIDEVGRGCLAGPLVVGAVVLPEHPHIEELNDSKQLTEQKRTSLAHEIKQVAQAWAVYFLEPEYIDNHGMTASLKKAFSGVVAHIEEQNITPDIVLLDGNPLGFDTREVNVVKGDAQCASIAAASIVAKVERDQFMIAAEKTYPGYGFARHKGYGTHDHREAIRKLGLTDFHRKSFCSEFLQDTLF